MQQKKKKSVILKRGKEGVGLGRRGKKWAGLVRLIAPELCRKNKLSCRRRAEQGWAEQGTGIAGGATRRSIGTRAGRIPPFKTGTAWTNDMRGH